MADDAIAILRDALPEGYTVEGYIASGGQGTVYRGTLNGNEIALNVFQTDMVNLCC